MTEETTEHLNRIEQAVLETKRLLARNGYPDNLRTVIVIGFIDQMIEHHEAMLLLIRNGKPGSAFSLARSIVESMYRGLWINFPATDAQVQGFEQSDELPIGMTQLARSIDQSYQADGFYEGMKNRAWVALCSYAHTGMLQLGRRFTGANVEPAYTEEEIVEVTTSVTTCVLLLVGRFLIVQGHPAESRSAEALVQTYGAAQRNKGPQPII